MKIVLSILLVLLPVILFAQIPDKDSLAGKVMEELKETWTLGVDSNSNVVDINIYNRFKSLFDEQGTITDALSIQYDPKTRSYQWLEKVKDFDEYAHHVALQVVKFTIDKWDVTMGKFHNLDSLIVQVQLLGRADKPARYVLGEMEAMADSILLLHPDTEFEKSQARRLDTIKKERRNNLVDKLKQQVDKVHSFSFSTVANITLVMTNDTTNPVKIKRVNIVNNTVNSLNDKDGDGILDAEDSKPATFGAFTTIGAPDSDLDGVADSTDKCKSIYGSKENYGCPGSFFTTNKEITMMAGVQFNQLVLNLPELNQLGYTTQTGEDAMDVLQSQMGSLRKSGTHAGMFAGANIAFYFGQKAKKAGVSVGVNYTSFIADVEMVSPIVYTYKANDGNDDYRRQITIRRLVEEIKFNGISIPVQFNYRFRPGASNNWAVNVKAGPSLMLFYGTSDYNTDIDIGGIYQVDTINKDRITYYNFFDNNSTYNVYLTSTGINQQNTSPGAAAVFAQLNNSSEAYDFVFDKNYRNKSRVSRTAIAGNFSVSGLYRKNQDSPIALMLGAHLVYATLPELKEKYIPLERTRDQFNSIFNSTASSSYIAYGLHVGIAYHF